MIDTILARRAAVTVACFALLVACGGDDDDPVPVPVPVPEETRAQDSRTFSPANPTATTFDGMAAAQGDTIDMSTTSRWAKGNSRWLVQRAIRGISHCDFTIAEQASAFDAMVTWEAGGVRPAGDNVVDTAVVAQPTYGCSFTQNSAGPDDDAGTLGLRQIVAATTAACP